MRWLRMWKGLPLTGVLQAASCEEHVVTQICSSCLDVRLQCLCCLPLSRLQAARHSLCMQPPLGYVAPELANADGQTAASSISSAADIFSLGTTLPVALRSSQPPCEQTPMCNAACGCVGKSELAVSNCKLEIQACLCSVLCL